MLGGQMLVDGAPGRGTTITVLVPLLQEPWPPFAS
jgi:hypothetical protein